MNHYIFCFNTKNIIDSGYDYHTITKSRLFMHLCNCQLMSFLTCVPKNKSSLVEHNILNSVSVRYIFGPPYAPYKKFSPFSLTGYWNK